MSVQRAHAHLTESGYAARRKRVLKQSRGGAALFVAPAESHRSGEESPAMNKDLAYLTGFLETDCALLLVGANRGPRSVLFVRDRDPQSERWTGERLGIKRARRQFAVDEVRDISRLTADLGELLSPCHTLFYAPGMNARVDGAVWSLFKQTPAPRLRGPNTLVDSRLLTSEMRFVKDRDEIRAIRHACDITSRALAGIIPRTKEFSSERHAAQLLESQFTRLGAHGLAFPTIVASGKNATVLHHVPRLQPLWRRELVLFDCGASFHGYASDISRTFPASGRFSPAQADVYDIVLAARDRAIERAKPGATLDELHIAATKQLIRGLIDLGILKGSPNGILESGAYRPYYMHRTGHWLGLDVHDIAPVTHPDDSHIIVPPAFRPFLPGCVFTVEPGLYFDPKDPAVPLAYRGIGIRIEDDILITAEGSEVLTFAMPSLRTDIEALFS